MSDDERDPFEMLVRARRAWSPGEADAARVRRAIAATLTAGPASGGAPALAAPRARASTWTSRLLIAGAIAAASGGAGYWAGHRNGLLEARPVTSVTSLVPASAAALEAKAPSPVVPVFPSGEPTLAMPSLASPRRDIHGARRGSDNRTPTETESLALEVRALRNTERALRDGNPGLALAFLQDLDRQVPNGQLAEERDAAGTLARCARGDRPFGMNLAAEFTERHPGSVYRARVEQACTETDSPAPGDSSPRRSER